MIYTLKNPADFNFVYAFFFNLDEQLWKLEDTVDPQIIKLVNKVHGDVQLTLDQADQAEEFTINIRNTGTNMVLDANGNEIIEFSTLGSLKWEKFPPNCAGYFRICYINGQSEEQLFTATTPNNFVLEPPSQTAATISGKGLFVNYVSI